MVWTSSSSDSGTLGTAGTVGAIVGTLVFLLIFIVLIWLMLRSSWRRRVIIVQQPVYAQPQYVYQAVPRPQAGSAAGPTRTGSRVAL